MTFEFQRWFLWYLSVPNYWCCVTLHVNSCMYLHCTFVYVCALSILGHCLIIYLSVHQSNHVFPSICPSCVAFFICRTACLDLYSYYIAVYIVLVSCADRRAILVDVQLVLSIFLTQGRHTGWYASPAQEISPDTPRHNCREPQMYNPCGFLHVFGQIWEQRSYVRSCVCLVRSILEMNTEEIVFGFQTAFLLTWFDAQNLIQDTKKSCISSQVLFPYHAGHLHFPQNIFQQQLIHALSVVSSIWSVFHVTR